MSARSAGGRAVAALSCALSLSLGGARAARAEAPSAPASSAPGPTPTSAPASSAPRGGAARLDPGREAFELAERAASARDFAEALARYDEAARLAPRAPFAGAARARADELRTHGEGGFVPLATLEAVRREPARASDARAIDELARAIEAFPEGRVRAEAWLFVGECYLDRLGRPGDARRALERAAFEPGGDRLVRALAVQKLVMLHRAAGDLTSALEAARRDTTLAPGLSRELSRLWRRERLTSLSLAWLGALALVLATSLAWLGLRERGARALREVVRPSWLVPPLYLGLGGALVVRLYGAGDVRPFLLLGLGLTLVVIAARAWALAAGPRGGVAYASGRALVCGVGALAAAFAALAKSDVAYLEGFGL